MRMNNSGYKLAGFRAAMMIAALSVSVPGYSQGGESSAREAAPFDLEGYWVSIVTEDWMYRMVTPARGSYGNVPMSAEGRRVADNWNADMDEAAGEQCKAYGAAAIMRMPGRIHVTWEDDSTLQIETDTGMQTRQFHFAGESMPGGEPTWQGISTAQWQDQGNLKVMTSQMRPGYLRKNGVPYGENATLTEYYERISAPNEDEWLVITTIVEDPLYLNNPYVTSTHFKKLSGASGWNPTSCSAS